MDQDAAPAAAASDDEEEPEAASPRSPWRIEHDVQVTETTRDGYELFHYACISA